MPKTQALGVATCTTALCAGSVVPHAEEGVGAIATQATTNIFHGVNGLRLLRMGFEPKRVLESTLMLDPYPEFRQVLIIDSSGGLRHAQEAGIQTGRGMSREGTT